MQKLTQSVPRGQVQEYRTKQAHSLSVRHEIKLKPVNPEVIRPFEVTNLRTFFTRRKKKMPIKRSSCSREPREIRAAHPGSVHAIRYPVPLEQQARQRNFFHYLGLQEVGQLLQRVVLPT